MVPYSHSFGGCQRMFFLADFLSKKGHDITVIASKKINNGYFGKSLIFKAKYYGDEVERKESNMVPKSSFHSKIKSSIRTIVEKLIDFYYNEPSNIMALRANIWLKKYKKDIIEQVKAGVDTVIISGPPFILFSFVSELKKSNPNVNVIVDYRDPWGLWNLKRSYAYIREKKILLNADKIVVVTPLAKEETLKHFKLSDENKINVIYNGYSDSVWEGIKPISNLNSKGKLKVSFVGAIDFSENSYRDTSKLLDVYSRYAEFVDLVFIGVELTPPTLNLMDKFPNITFVEKVTQDESIEYMLNSDVLLTLHTANDDSGKFLIQGKVFDYMKARKPIWSIGSLSDFTNTFILDNHLGLVSENNSQSISNTLDCFLKLKSSNSINSFFEVDDRVIEEYSREKQYIKYLDLL